MLKGGWAGRQTPISKFDTLALRHMAGALKTLRSVHRLSLTMTTGQTGSLTAHMYKPNLPCLQALAKHNTQWSVDYKFELNY